MTQWCGPAVHARDDYEFVVKNCREQCETMRLDAAIASAGEGGGLETHGQGGLLDAVGVPDVHPPLVHQSLPVDLLLRQALVVGVEPAGGTRAGGPVGCHKGLRLLHTGKQDPLTRRAALGRVSRTLAGARHGHVGHPRALGDRLLTLYHGGRRAARPDCSGLLVTGRKGAHLMYLCLRDLICSFSSPPLSSGGPAARRPPHLLERGSPPGPPGPCPVLEGHLHFAHALP